MPGPARAGAVVYAKDLDRVSAFYRALLSMTLRQHDADHHVIESADMQLVVHAIPPHIAATFTIASPPEPREDTAVKLFFTVDAFDDAAATAQAHGGRLLARAWAGPGFVARDALDPEGNVLQLRVLAP